jgi:drug/metabolite transporter (DMT)-like permease
VLYGCEFLLAAVHLECRRRLAPSAAITYIGNAFAAKFFLHENVDKRRWISAAFVTAGVALLAK